MCNTIIKVFGKNDKKYILKVCLLYATSIMYIKWIIKYKLHISTSYNWTVLYSEK